MPYTSNGKIITNNPIMDEIVYGCKLILKGIVVKNEYTAFLYETEETLQMAEYYMKCLNGTITFAMFPFTKELLMSYGYDENYATKILNNREKYVPVREREALMEYSIQYFLDTFEEKNKYYRSLMGLPEYGTHEFDLYITEKDLPYDYDIDTVDFTLPIHQQPNNVIATLKSTKVLDKIIESHRSFNYSYLRFLGDNRLELRKIRKAGKWDILYIPAANTAVIDRFQELYYANREIYLKRVYQQAYAFDGNYFDHCCIVMLLSQTFNDMITDYPEWFIRRDIFDLRSVQFFLESYGIPYFDEIPLKYQIRIVKNINKLLKYKSSEENFNDILKIFALQGTAIYKYFLYKKRKVDEHGEYIEDPDLEKMFDLQFVEVKLGDSYDNYIKNFLHRTPYDEITLGDKYWDGTDDHETVKHQILERDFTIEPSKYMSIKADVDFNEFQRQIRYFLSLVLDSRTDIHDITVSVPILADGVSFKVSDLFLFIEVVTNLYYKMSLDIIRPEDVNEPTTEHKDDFVPKWDDDLDNEWWLKERYPETFIASNDRVFGFNPELNLKEVTKLIERDFTNSRMTDYTLADFGCDKYVSVNGKIDTFDELMRIYETNMQCYDKLNKTICYRTDTKDKSRLGNYLFRELFTKRYDYGFGEGCETLDEVLKRRDYTLWSFYKNLTYYTDDEARKTDIEAALNEIINNLEYYLSRDSLDYLFTFVPTASISAVLRYIYLMLSAFKSYKVHFIEPVITYKIGYPDLSMDNQIEFRDTFKNIRISAKKWDAAFLNDIVSRVVIKDCKDYTNRFNFLEILDIFTLFSPDPNDNYIYNGKGAKDEQEAFKYLNGGTAENCIPYKMINGQTAYGVSFLQWNIDGRFPSTDHQFEVDGGHVSDDINEWEVSSEFVTNFTNMIDAQYSGNDAIVKNNFFARLYDHQEEPDMRIAARTGMEYKEEGETIILTEIWRQWMTVNDFEYMNDLNVLGNLYSKQEKVKDIYRTYEKMERPTDDPDTDLYHLDNLYNDKIDTSIEDVMYADASKDFVDEFDWNFGDIDEDNLDEFMQVDYDFGDIDEPEYDPKDLDATQVYEFHEIFSKFEIIFISDMGNRDTARVLTIT